MRLTERSINVPVSEQLYAWLHDLGSASKTPPQIVVRQLLEKLMPNGRP